MKCRDFCACHHHHFARPSAHATHQTPNRQQWCHRGIGQPPTCMRFVFGGMYNPGLHARCIGWYALFVPFLFPTFSATSTAVNVLQKIKRVPFRTFICAIFDSLRHSSRAVHVKAVARSLALAVAVVYVTCSCALAVRSASTTFIRARTNVESRNATGDFVRDDKAP